MSLTTNAALRILSGEHDRFKHYVLASDLRTSLLWGTAVQALCGKMWKPDGDPSQYPLCPTCRDIGDDE